MMNLIIFLIASLPLGATSPPAPQEETIVVQDTTWRWSFSLGDNDEWTVAEDGALRWSVEHCHQCGDSLMLQWPSGIPSATVLLSMAVDAPPPEYPGTTYVQISVRRDDGESLAPFLYTHISPLLLDPESLNCFAITEGVAADAQIDVSDLQELRIRVAAAPCNAPHPPLVIRELRIHGQAYDRSLIPLPEEALGEFYTGNDSVPMWRLAMSAGACWKLAAPPLRVPLPGVIRVSVPILGADQLPHPPTLFWARGSDKASWQQVSLVASDGENDSLYQSFLFLEDNQDDTRDSLDILLRTEFLAGEEEQDPLLVGPTTISVREACPRPGEIRIIELQLSPSEDEFVELASLLSWPIHLSNVNVVLNDQTHLLPEDHTLPPNGCIALNADLVPALHLPNSGLDVAVMCKGRTIDSVSCGPRARLPIPPYGWSLALKCDQWAVDPEPSPGRPNGDLPPSHVENPLLVLSEVMFWPENSSRKFIEITNLGRASVPLRNWLVYCEDVLPLPADSALCQGSSMVLSSEGFPPYFALNLDEGMLMLIDERGLIADRFSWASSPEQGLSFQRIAHPGAEGDEWGKRFPTPGTLPSCLSTPCRIQVSRTVDGTVLQWTCVGAESLSYHIYRAPHEDPDDTTRISTFPVEGPEPFNFIDLSAQPDTAYLYWVVAEDGQAGRISIGPVYSPPDLELLPIQLSDPRPNPFKGSMDLAYTISPLTPEFKASLLEEYHPGTRMQLAVYTVNGRMIRLLEIDRFQQGTFTATWNGTDEQGQQCPPGIYVISLQLGPLISSVKTVYMGE